MRSTWEYFSMVSSHHLHAKSGGPVTSKLQPLLLVRTVSHLADFRLNLGLVEGAHDCSCGAVAGPMPSLTTTLTVCVPVLPIHDRPVWQAELTSGRLNLPAGGRNLSLR